MNSYVLILIGILLLVPASAADEKGWVGLELSVEIEGFAFNPTLQAVTIKKVIPGSPAAAAGLVSGDRIVEIQGRTIPGAKARELKDAMHRTVGESLRLKIQRGSAAPRAVTLVAVAKP